MVFTAVAGAVKAAEVWTQNPNKPAAERTGREGGGGEEGMGLTSTSLLKRGDPGWRREAVSHEEKDKQDGCCTKTCSFITNPFFTTCVLPRLSQPDSADSPKPQR